MLSANFLNLEADIQMINESQADWFHLDVMDGVFVPNISYGFPVIEHINKLAAKPLDVHLMIEKPERFITEFKNAGADILTVHIEASTHLHRTLQSIRNQGMKAGVALNPHTNVASIEDVLHDADMVLIMSVNPGFGGQKFIPQSLKRVEKLRNMIEIAGSETIIQVDGGVTDANAKDLYSAGATCLVAGSYVFKSANPCEAIIKMKA